MKPRISAAAAEAYQRVSALEPGTPVKVDGEDAVFLGMTGYLVTIRARGETMYFRVGAPTIERLTR